MTLSLVLDGIMIVLLAGTMLYAARLSVHIRTFRDTRREMEGLLATLTGNIDRAERAVEGLRESARQSGRDLQIRIGEARALSEELQIISESGNSLATRLERLADRSVRTPPPRRERGEPSGFAMAPAAPPAPQADRPGPLAGFAIRDPEFERPEDKGVARDDGDDGNVAAPSLASRAERDLYDALRRSGAEGRL